MQNPLTKATQTTTILGRLTGFTGYSYLRILKSGKSTIEAHDNEEVSRQNALLRVLDNLSHAARMGYQPGWNGREGKGKEASGSPSCARRR